ncbi:hypothetical protein [Bacillus manliponensis]|uniref:hypothetical protein n=1 Tax=Bacillus manliponensis TaxID=574376 RepID=UPI0035156EA5
MLAKMKKVKLEKENTNPIYQVKLECPKGKELYIKFDYTHYSGTFMPLAVSYNGRDKGTKLLWYTEEVENMNVQKFLTIIARKINRHYGFELKPL